jgi:hypothetical protein
VQQRRGGKVGTALLWMHLSPPVLQPRANADTEKAVVRVTKSRPRRSGCCFFWGGVAENRPSVTSQRRNTKRCWVLVGIFRFGAVFLSPPANVLCSCIKIPQRNPSTAVSGVKGVPDGLEETFLSQHEKAIAPPERSNEAETKCSQGAGSLPVCAVNFR